MTDIADPPAENVIIAPAELGAMLLLRLEAIETDLAGVHEEIHEVLRLTRGHSQLLERFRPLIDRWAARLPLPGVPAAARPRGRGRIDG